MTTQEKIKKVLNDIETLLNAKNSNYGNSALQPPKLLLSVTAREAILVRLSDKLARIETLAKGEPDKVGESFDDTLRDIVGYITLYFACEEMDSDCNNNKENK